MQEFECDDGTYGCYELCKYAIESLQGEDKHYPMYRIEQRFSGDVKVESGRLAQKERLLYRLDVDNYTPF